MTNTSPNVVVKKTPSKPVMSMIIPGRRAFGEKWSKVTVGVDADGYTVEREDTEAPARKTPIFVPALGNISIEMTDYILEKTRHDQKYRVGKPRPSQQEISERLNKMWLDWIEQKLRHFQGKTVSGPGGWTQRERGADRHG